jgi:IclR family acetate operon transcriptional repressor
MVKTVGPGVVAGGSPRSRRATPELGATGVGLSSLGRAVAVLDLFADNDTPTLGVSEIARRLGLPKAGIHRILSSLRVAGYVQLEETSRRYRLGPSVLRLGEAYLKRLDVRDLAREPMARLSRQTRETVTLSIRSGASRVYVQQVVPDSDVRMVVDVGRPFPLHAGSTSKAFLAHLSEPEIEDYLSRPLEALTENTIIDPEELRRELRVIRSRGYASSRGERQPGASSVAAPILDAHGRPVAVMSVCGPLERFGARAPEAAMALLPVTRELSERLGYSPEADDGGLATAGGLAMSGPTSTSPNGGPTG